MSRPVTIGKIGNFSTEKVRKQKQQIARDYMLRGMTEQAYFDNAKPRQSFKCPKTGRPMWLSACQDRRKNMHLVSAMEEMCMGCDGYPGYVGKIEK